jgi:hypothetical protein
MSMQSDLRQLRRHAFTCAEMAQRASTPQLAGLLVDLSKNWMQLANELERIQAWLERCRSGVDEPT